MQQISIVQVEPVDYELFSASIKSINCRSEVRVKGKISAVRLPDMNIAVNVIKTSGEWKFYENAKKVKND